MPIVQFTDCQAEGDLATAVLNLQQVVGDAALAVTQQINAIDVLVPLLAQADNILDQEIALNNSGLTYSDLATQTGLPQDPPTQLDDEERLEALGIIVIDGVMYLEGTDQNIANFRKLFFAVGANITTFLSVINGSQSPVIVQTQLSVQALPTTQTWTLAQAQATLNNPAIEAVYTAGDGVTYCVVPTFLALNQSVEQVSALYNIPAQQIVTQVFWLTELSQTSQVVNLFNNFGIMGSFQNAAITGNSFSSLAPSQVTAQQDLVSTYTSQAISQVQLLNQRYAVSTPASRNVYKNEIISSEQSAQAALYGLEGMLRFNPTIITDPQDINVFLTQNTQADLVYLFSVRQTVESINFQASLTDISNALNQASLIPSGSSTVSSLLVNEPGVPLDPNINQANSNLISNMCALNQLSTSLTDIPYQNLQTAYSCMQASMTLPPAPTVSTSPVIGYASYDSPSTLMGQLLNFSATFNFNGLLSQLTSAAKKVSQLLYVAVVALAAVLQTMQNAINQVMGTLRSKVSAVTSQIQSFVSKFMSMHGTATLDSSILKCALGLNLQPTLPFINSLDQILDLLQRQLRNLLTQIAKAITSFLTQLLCLPLNLINQFIQSAATQYLPSVCQANTVQLPSDVQSVLNQIRMKYQAENTTFLNFGQNLAKLNGTVEAIPGKLAQFQQDLICQNPQSSSFFSTDRQNINLGVGTNPISQLAQQIQSATPNLAPVSSPAASSFNTTGGVQIPALPSLNPVRG